MSSTPQTLRSNNSSLSLPPLYQLLGTHQPSPCYNGASGLHLPTFPAPMPPLPSFHLIKFPLLPELLCTVKLLCVLLEVHDMKKQLKLWIPCLCSLFMLNVSHHILIYLCFKVGHGAITALKYRPLWRLNDKSSLQCEGERSELTVLIKLLQHSGNHETEMRTLSKLLLNQR